MAELITAFKSKYSGEEIDNLLDRIKDMGGTPTGIVTTSYPYERTNQKYETDNILITSNHMDKVGNYSGTGGRTEDIIFDDTTGISSGTYSNEWEVIHEFKNNLKAKLKTAHIRIVEGSHAENYSIKIYYVDFATHEEVLMHSYAWRSTGGGTIKNFDIDAPTSDTMVSKMIVRVILRGTIQHITYDFEIVSTDSYATNSLENVSMQNEFTETEV